jgi:NitT/TauT family transport system ATP-binding protein
MQEYLIRLFEEAPVTTVFVTSEIEEAIFLADRILVVSNAPASLKRVVEVDLPRPRDLKILTSSRFGEIHGTILDLLLEEAKKNFAEGITDAAEVVESYGRAARGQALRMQEHGPPTVHVPAVDRNDFLPTCRSRSHSAPR